jgi:hypothetical protein
MQRAILDHLREHPDEVSTGNTSTVEHSGQLQPSRRRSIPVANGERTATLKTETKMRSRTLLIDASAAPRATATAASRIVRIEIKTLTSRRPPTPAPRRLPSPDAVATGASLWPGFTTRASRARLPHRCHGPRTCCPALPALHRPLPSRQGARRRNHGQ